MSGPCGPRLRCVHPIFSSYKQDARDGPDARDRASGHLLFITWPREPSPRPGGLLEPRASSLHARRRACSGAVTSARMVSRVVYPGCGRGCTPGYGVWHHTRGSTPGHVMTLTLTSGKEEEVSRPQL